MADPPMGNKVTTGIISLPRPKGDTVIGDGRVCHVPHCSPTAALPWGTSLPRRLGACSGHWRAQHPSKGTDTVIGLISPNNTLKLYH